MGIVLNGHRAEEKYALALNAKEKATNPEEDVAFLLILRRLRSYK